MRTLSGRWFLRAVGAGVALSAISPVLTSCTASEQTGDTVPADPTNDREYVPSRKKDLL